MGVVLDMSKQLDLLIINPGASTKIYQSLAAHYTTIEPPSWGLLIAEAMRSKGFSVQILDCDALRISDEFAALVIKHSNPKLSLVVSYGQNPNSSTTSMTGAISLAEEVKLVDPSLKIAVMGSHVQALPSETLDLGHFDFIITGEGIKTIPNLLLSDLDKDLPKIRGIGFRRDGQNIINEYEDIVGQNEMDSLMPGYAFDLLDYHKKPFDIYRAPPWHALYNEDLRSPYAAIYTSLGCFFQCGFCLINIINRTKAGNHISAADSNIMRTWSTDWVLRQIDYLVSKGVRTIKFSDELFIAQPKHYEPILKGIIERGYNDLLIWSYSRVSTVKEKYLELCKNAGMKYLALGIESGSQTIRQEIDKGSFRDVNIRDVVKKVHDHDINIIGNYIYGLKGDNHETMQNTLNLAMELNTAAYNSYPCHALPGSPLYLEMKKKGVKLPSNFSEWSFLSYDCQPLPTDYLSAAEVLKFRDESWHIYHNRPEYLSMIEGKFGLTARTNIEEMAKIKLKRKLLGD